MKDKKKNNDKDKVKKMVKEKEGTIKNVGRKRRESEWERARCNAKKRE